MLWPYIDLGRKKGGCMQEPSFAMIVIGFGAFLCPCRYTLHVKPLAAHGDVAHHACHSFETVRLMQIILYLPALGFSEMISDHHDHTKVMPNL